MKWRVAGNTYIREIPDGQVKREAPIYAMYRNPLEGFIGPEEVNETNYFGPNCPGLGPDSPYRKVQETPDIGPWRYEIFEADYAAFQEAGVLTDHLITDERADWFTDIFLWTPFSFVRQNVKDFLEAYDAGGHLFLPTKLLGKKTKTEIPGGPYCQWLPARRLFLLPDFEVPPKTRVAKKVLNDWFGSEDVVWQFQNNRPFRDFLTSLKCFGFFLAMTSASTPQRFTR